MTDVDFEIRKKVEELLQRFNILKPPVPVDQLTKQLGILLCLLPADDEISGAIVRKDGRVVVAINPAHHNNRQRFTIAHELATSFFTQAWEEHVSLVKTPF
ncbi:MAG: ImmA/IrrE family metallo-endopeptidase [Acidobacteriia bacterium]|nr:ImmA/IrrE family metallo-endopeptidase [Terriglobia bacterium]